MQFPFRLLTLSSERIAFHRANLSFQQGFSSFDTPCTSQHHAVQSLSSTHRRWPRSWTGPFFSPLFSLARTARISHALFCFFSSIWTRRIDGEASHVARKWTRLVPALRPSFVNLIAVNSSGSSGRVFVLTCELTSWVVPGGFGPPKGEKGAL